MRRYECIKEHNYLLIYEVLFFGEKLGVTNPSISILVSRCIYFYRLDVICLVAIHR
jgi:hypothetical protein